MWWCYNLTPPGPPKCGWQQGAIVSPVLVRPVREQLEHDRIIRLLHGRWKRRFQVGVNPGAEQNAPVGAGDAVLYPDLVLASPERGRKLKAIVEVETTESVNSLEALSEWARMAQARAPFHLYVPATAIEAAKRLCSDHGIGVDEIWSFYLVGDQMRFTRVYRAPAPPPTPRARASRAPARPARATKRRAAAKKGVRRRPKPSRKARSVSRPKRRQGRSGRTRS